MAKRSLIVVGGSLVGPAVALDFLKRGWDVKLYDAVAPTASRAGGVITLQPDNIRYLNFLGIDRDRILPMSGCRQRVLFRRVDSNARVVRIEQVSPGLDTNWNVLHAALLEKLPKGVFHPGYSCIDLVAPRRGLLRKKRWGVVFQHGNQQITERADLVVFADGKGSTGRRLLNPTRTNRYNGRAQTFGN